LQIEESSGVAGWIWILKATFGPIPTYSSFEYVTKSSCRLLCTGTTAQYSYHKTSNDSVVMLGEQQEYEP
jgi:thymidine kinase